MDPMGLAAAGGAGSIGPTLQQLLQQRIMQEQMSLQIAKAIADQQMDTSRLGLARDQLTQQGQQFDASLGQRKTEHGFDVRKYDEGAPARAAETEGLQLRNQGVLRGMSARDALRGDPTYGQAVTAREADIPVAAIDTQDPTGATDQQRALERIKATGDQNVRAATVAAERAAAAAARKNLGDLTPAQASAVFKYQDDFARDSKGFVGIRDAYQRVVTAAKKPDAAGDLSLIFGYMKMLDPNSVVREQEFANAQNAAGVPDQVRNLYNRALSGERLNPNQRQQFVGQARQLFDVAKRNQAQVSQQYSRRAQKFGIDPLFVVEDLNTGAENADAPADSAGPEVGTRRTIKGKLAEWDGKGWLPVSIK